jgi:hypothetical protein
MVIQRLSLLSPLLGLANDATFLTDYDHDVDTVAVAVGPREHPF